MPLPCFLFLPSLCRLLFNSFPPFVKSNILDLWSAEATGGNQHTSSLFIHSPLLSPSVHPLHLTQSGGAASSAHPRAWTDTGLAKRPPLRQLNQWRCFTSRSIILQTTMASHWGKIASHCATECLSTGWTGPTQRCFGGPCERETWGQRGEKERWQVKIKARQ